MFSDILESLLYEKGITASKMLSDLGLNKSSVLNWKTRGTIPSGSVLQKIADYFNVSVDYLLGNDEMKKPAGVPDELWEELCKDEDKMRLATWICQLSGEDLDRVEKLLDAALLSPPE